jgi:primase-polymerase (primpol)-like protein
MIVVERLPVEIRESTRAVAWRWVRRRVRGAWRWTKPPFQARLPDLPADVSDPRTWAPLADALAAVAAGRAAGVGVVLGAGIVGVDLDGCCTVETGAITDDALAIVRAIDSYTEVSPSGTGLHVLVRGTLPPHGRRRGDVEMYAARRFFCLTGEHLAGTPRTIEERTAALAVLHARIFGTNGNGHREGPRRVAGTVEPDDAALLRRACAARNGGKFVALFWRGDVSGYRSPSEADQALANLLAFWTAGDGARVDRLFRRSGLMRAKWERSDYRERTIAKAIGST